MSLTKQDLQDIAAIVADSEQRMTAQIAANTELISDLATHLDERFAEQDAKFSDKMSKSNSALSGDIANAKEEITEAIEVRENMHTEDTVAIVDDVTDLKQRVTRLEQAAA